MGSHLQQLVKDFSPCQRNLLNKTDMQWWFAAGLGGVSNV